MTVWLCIAALWVTGIGGPGVAPLTAGQRAQAQTFTDDAPPDQPALYALLADVASWEAGDDAGARLPDWSVIFEKPETWRGEPVLLEGVYAGRQRRWPLMRPDPRWGEALTEWGVIVGRNVAEVRRDPAAQVRAGSAWPVVVLFVDPDAALEPPASAGNSGKTSGGGVRIVARFLGIWEDTDQAGTAQRYPVFVAKHAQAVPALAGRAGAIGVVPGGWGGVAAAALLVAAVLMIFWRLRSLVRRRDVVAERRARRERARATVEPIMPEVPDGGGDADPPRLPADADAALERLRNPDR